MTKIILLLMKLNEVCTETFLLQLQRSFDLRYSDFANHKKIPIWVHQLKRDNICSVGISKCNWGSRTCNGSGFSSVKSTPARTQARITSAVKRAASTPSSSFAAARRRFRTRGSYSANKCLVGGW